tara:strand:- start:1225 stop:2088 length:864 start_codon:yes stop_codon:yes gene_type:complete
MKKINLKALQDISDLPKLLLSENPQIRWKNHQSVSREFEIEKWGSLLSLSKKDNISVELLEKKMHEHESYKPFLYQDDLYIDYPINISNFFLKKSIKLLKKIYAEHNCRSVMEIGAGYGRLLIPFVNELSNEDYEGVVGADYTFSSGQILDNLSKNLKYNIFTTQMDVSGKNQVRHSLQDIKMKRPIIFTCQTIMYVPFLEESFFNLMKTWSDAIFCNFEPTYPKASLDKLKTLQRKYIEVNDYNRNLEKFLNKKEKKGVIKIISSYNSEISENVFLPLKNIVWKFN